MSINFPVKNAGEKLLESEVQGLRLDILQHAGDVLVDSGSADAYIVTCDEQITTLQMGQIVKFIASETNTGASTLQLKNDAVSPTLDVTDDIVRMDGSPLLLGDIPEDGTVLLFFDGTNWQILNPAKSSSGKFGGDGSDGDLVVSSDTTLNPSYKTFNYKNLTIDATFALSFGANYQNKVVHIKVQGDCIINGTLNLKGAGSVGGAGGDAGADGVDGGAIHSDCLDSNSHNGVKGVIGVSATGGVGGSALTINSGVTSLYLAPQTKRVMYLLPGVGGGGGAGGESGISPVSGGAGGTISSLPVNGADGADASGGGRGGSGGGAGAGGGALILEVAGNLTIGASGVIDLSGQNGANAGGGGDAISSGRGGSGGGGGGGGAGGMGVILYGGTLTNSGTIDVSGGDGGSGGARGDGISDPASVSAGSGGGGGGFHSGAGGQGGATRNTTPSSSADGNSGSAGGGGAGIEGSASSGALAGGAGGAGSSTSGAYILEKNVTFA